MRHNELSGTIVKASLDIHCKLGPGLLESVYQEILFRELRKQGLHVLKEVPIPVEWDDVRVDVGFRADLIVEDLVVVELKSLECVAAVHKKILLTYLRLTDKRLGLLINFGMAYLRDGVTRLVNGLEDGS